MGTLNHNIPRFRCFVRAEFLYAFESHQGEFEPGMCHAVATLENRALGFHVLLDNGAHIGRLPIHAIVTDKGAPPIDVQKPWLVQTWDCFSTHAAVVEYDWLSEVRCRVILPDKSVHGGTYLFTVDYYGSETAESAGDSGWKAQPVDEPVLTPDGWRPIGDICVGDKVIGRNGRPIQVTGVFHRGAQDVYAVSFHDGAFTRACADHLWTVARSGRKSKTVSTADLRNLRKPGEWALPPLWSPRFHGTEGASDLPVDPYLLGVLLGDGGVTQSTPTIHTDDPEIIRHLVLPRGCSIEQDAGTIRYRITGKRGRENILTKHLRRLGVFGKRAWEKSIPEIYLYADPTQRFELLRGLMDTDGHVHVRSSGRPRPEFYTSSEKLSLDVQYLVRSLGGIAFVSGYPRQSNGKFHQRAYHVSIRTRYNPFKLKRKAEKWKKPTSVRRVLNGVSPAGREECVCISVSAPDGLYVTRDFIVTHNCHNLLELDNGWIAALPNNRCCFFESSSVTPFEKPPEYKTMPYTWKVEDGMKWRTEDSNRMFYEIEVAKGE